MESSYEQLVKALRWCTSGGTYRHCDGCQYKLVKPEKYCLEEIMKDAAAAIEELQAEIRESMQKCAECGDANMPKRGEWVGVTPMVDTVQCSVCGGQLFSAELETPYCPYCGAKMTEVQDEA